MSGNRPEWGPKKSLGQHFLTDPRILARIAAALPAPPEAPIVEIGPGRGALTEALLRRWRRVTAIEKDRSLAARLEAMAPLRLIAGDALLVDWPAAAGVAPGEPWYLIGNIPYNITSPLIDKALAARPRPASIVFLMQREVADRLTAAPGTKEYGALTVGVGAVASVERLFTVPAGAFRPPPKVGSAVVRITPRASPFDDPRQARFRSLVVGLFGARRKQLLRALRTVTGESPERVREWLEQAGLEQTRRPETLSIEEFVRLAAIVDGGHPPTLVL